MKNIILINVEPFTPGRDKFFHVNELRQDHFDVKVWDLSILSLRGTDFPDVIVDDYVKVFKNFAEIKIALNQVDIKETFFIVQVPFNDKTYPLYKELKKRKCYVARFDFYTNTFYEDNYHIDLQFSWRNTSVFFDKLFKKFRNYIKWKRNKIKWSKIHYDCRLSPLNGDNITGHINHPDYDNFIFHKEERLLDYRYLVFCDNYFPYHPDLIEKVDGIDGKKYQKQMSELFTYLEKKTGLPIVIAAHPKAKYIGKEFGNRRIMKFKTNNLVQYSEGVIFHTSNSLSYAIMANKPILSVTTNDYELLRFPFDKLSKYLEIPYYNLDQNSMSDIEFHSISKDVREKYIYSFLTNKECESIDNYTIIKETILKAKNLKI